MTLGFFSVFLAFCFHKHLPIFVQPMPKEPGIMRSSCHTVDFKNGTPMATLPGAWRYRVSAGNGRPGVSIMRLGETESSIRCFYLICSTYTCLGSSVLEIQQHVARTLSNQLLSLDRGFSLEDPAQGAPCYYRGFTVSGSLALLFFLRLLLQDS